MSYGNELELETKAWKGVGTMICWTCQFMLSPPKPENEDAMNKRNFT